MPWDFPPFSRTSCSTCLSSTLTSLPGSLWIAVSTRVIPAQPYCVLLPCLILNAHHVLLNLDADFNFHTSLLVSTLCFLALALLAATAKLAGKDLEASNNGCIAKLGKRADAFVTGSLVIAYAIYPSLSAKVFATFNCRSIAGDARQPLRADYSIDCRGDTHKRYEAYATAMVLLISVGVPALYLGLIWKNHNAVQHGARSVRYLRFLVQDYNPDCWFVQLLRSRAHQ